MFNTHTQSIYEGFTNSLYVNSYVSNYTQIKELRQYMQQKVLGNPKNYNQETDLVIVAGDFNVNALSVKGIGLK